MKALKETDIEAYYRARPWERPLTPEEQKKKEAEDRAYWEREAKRRGRRSPRPRRYSEKEARKDSQAANALWAGRESAGKVNLEPFLDKGNVKTPKELKK